MPKPDGSLWTWEQRALARERSCRRVPTPPWFNATPLGFCRWCGLEARGVRGQKVNWHSACVGEYNFVRDPSYSTAVLDKTHGRCAGCKTLLRTWSRLGERDSGTIGYSVNPVQIDGPCSVVSSHKLEFNVDHIRPLWSVDRAGLGWRQLLWFFTLPNLQALCPPCHKAKSAREAAERAALRRTPNGPQMGLAV